jgi:phospholipid transport system substrate-binding protein
MKNLVASMLRLSIAVVFALLVPVAAQAADSKKPAKAGKVEPSVETIEREPAPAKLPASPLAELKKYDSALKKLFQRKAPSWSPEADAKRSELRRIVASFLDFEELSKRSLGKHWDTITPKQRSEFTATLRDLIERSYIRQVHGAPDYNLVFEKETVEGNNADVTATLHTSARGKKVDVAIEYKLMARDNRWLVYDVVTDEQSMLENYRAEFNKIINKESFDALMKRMKKKLEEKE